MSARSVRGDEEREGERERWEGEWSGVAKWRTLPVSESEWRVARGVQSARATEGIFLAREGGGDGWMAGIRSCAGWLLLVVM